MVSQGYSPKDLYFGKGGKSKLADGVRKLSMAVRSTLGPSGNTVLIESPTHTHGITVTKDGVTVARSIDLMDPVENLAVRMMKEAADKTALSAGDGTTTSIVLTEALVEMGICLLEDLGVNRTAVLRRLVELSKQAVEDLKGMSLKLGSDMLKDVATISANNDMVIGELISDVYAELGENGIVTVERSQTADTYFETTSGLKIDRGYYSPLFINDHKKDECIFEDVSILVADMEISNILQLENVLRPVIQNGKKLLVIAPCHVNVVNTFAANVMKNNLKLCAIQPPSFGYKQHELMQDIALSVGATYFSEKTGDDLSHLSFEDLGHASKVIVGRDKTIIIKSSGSGDATGIEERVAQLWDAHALATKKADRDFLLERIASLTGGIGVIYVGGNTDLEQKELYDRVDDAVCAVRSALEEGVVPGGGKALYDLQISVDHKNSVDKIAFEILRHATQRPLYQILENADLKYDEVYPRTEKGVGYNLKSGEFGNMIGMGVIDPLKVTRSALENAVSVAVTILSTDAIVTMARSYETTNS